MPIDASERPWVATGRYIGTKNHMSLIGECRDVNGNWSDAEPASANAALIVEAVNNHDRLKASLEEMAGALERARIDLDAARTWAPSDPTAKPAAPLVSEEEVTEFSKTLDGLEVCLHSENHTGRTYAFMRDAIEEGRVLIQQSRAKPAPAQPSDAGWRTIDSAPDDGTNVLIAEDASESHGEAYYDKRANRWYWANTADGDYPEPHQPFPTHWQPLPAPPTHQPAPEPAQGDVEKLREALEGALNFIESEMHYSQATIDSGEEPSDQFTYNAIPIVMAGRAALSEPGHE